MNIKLTSINLAILALITIFSAKLAHAQDDDSFMDSPTIIPSSIPSQNSQPTIIDESDSNGVSEVDEYDN